MKGEEEKKRREERDHMLSIEGIKLLLILQLLGFQMIKKVMEIKKESSS